MLYLGCNMHHQRGKKTKTEDTKKKKRDSYVIAVYLPDKTL